MSNITPQNDILLAEYTLGLLNSRETQQAHALLGQDDDAVATALDWEERLLALTDLLAPVDPSPLVLQRIQTSLGHDTTPPPSTLYRKVAGAPARDAARSDPARLAPAPTPARPPEAPATPAPAVTVAAPAAAAPNIADSTIATRAASAPAATTAATQTSPQAPSRPPRELAESVSNARPAKRAATSGSGA